MSTKIIAATLLVLFVATLCTLVYAVGDMVRWAIRRPAGD
jgi:hypothetical protein